MKSVLWGSILFEDPFDNEIRNAVQPMNYTEVPLHFDSSLFMSREFNPLLVPLTSLAIAMAVFAFRYIQLEVREKARGEQWESRYLFVRQSTRASHPEGSWLLSEVLGYRKIFVSMKKRPQLNKNEKRETSIWKWPSDKIQFLKRTPKVFNSRWHVLNQN